MNLCLNSGLSFYPLRGDAESGVFLIENMEKNNIQSRFVRLTRFLEASEFRGLVFFLSILFLSWPYLAPADHMSLHFSFVYFFSFWFGLVLLIAATHIFSGREDKSRDDERI